MSKVCKHCPWKTQPLHTEFRVKSVSPALLLPCPCPGQAALRVASEDAHRYAGAEDEGVRLLVGVCLRPLYYVRDVMV